MHLFYTSFIFMALLGSFLGFIWMVTRLTEQASLQIMPESGFKKSLQWKARETYWTNRQPLPPMTSASRYFNTSIGKEEAQLMGEIDHIKDEQELAQWFILLKERYHHRNIPKKVYLRATTLLNGYRWFDSKEYDARIREGKPVHRVTEREYALEKKLELLMNRYTSDKQV